MGRDEGLELMEHSWFYFIFEGFIVVSLLVELVLLHIGWVHSCFLACGYIRCLVKQLIRASSGQRLN